MSAEEEQGRRKPALIVGAIGVVFGDIGTSPLYALKETFAGHHPMAVEPARILGVLSLIFWTIMVLVTLKYVAIIMRADNRGEGGSLALLARVTELTKGSRATLVRDHARHLRRRAVLRRQHDHAGHLGAERRRGPEHGRAGTRRTTCCRSRRSILTALFWIQRAAPASSGDSSAR